VSSRGDIHDILNPDNLTLSLKGALREELRPDWLGKEVYIGRSLNTFFDARWYNVTTHRDESINLDEYWKINQSPSWDTTDPHDLIERTSIRILAGYNSIGGYTKKVFSYGHLSTSMVLPTNPVGATETFAYVGFEAAGSSFLGLVCFEFRCTPANPTGTLYAFISDSLRSARLNITSLMPADAQTAGHTYKIQMTRDSIWFYIDYSLVSVIVINARTVSAIGPPPYAVGAMANKMSTHLPALFEFGSGGVENTWRLARFEVTDGEEQPSRTLDLYHYASASLMRGAVISSGSLASHPIPTHGFETKTISFRSNQAGTLDIEYLLGSGSWRAVPSPSPVAADTLLSFNLLDKAMLARVNFTPSAYPCTINEAEVELG